MTTNAVTDLERVEADRKRRLSTVWPDWLIDEIDGIAAEGRFKKGFLVSMVNEDVLQYVKNRFKGQVKNFAKERA